MNGTLAVFTHTSPSSSGWGWGAERFRLSLPWVYLSIPIGQLPGGNGVGGCVKLEWVCRGKGAPKPIVPPYSPSRPVTFTEKRI